MSRTNSPSTLACPQGVEQIERAFLAGAAHEAHQPEDALYHEDAVEAAARYARPFSFPSIDHFFDEATYLRAQHLIQCAAGLFGDGGGGDLGENEEYERGQAELICDACCIPQDLVDQVIAEIHEVARAGRG
jgi:hypothetical protein